MSEEPRRRRGLTKTGDKIVAIILVALVVITLLFSLLNALNLRLVAGELYIFLPTMTLLLLLCWAVSGLWRKMKRGVARTVVGGILIFAMMLVAMLVLSYVSMFAGITVPQRYTVVSDNGHSLVVMRALDSDEDRIQARHAARLEANPGAPDEITADDWGYTYTAYSQAMLGMLYHPDSLLEGEVHIGYASKAELMVEWEDDVGHFFIKNPEIGDEGEMRAQS